MKERNDMQHIHAFNISPKEYYIRGKKNDFPQVDVCPCCSYPAILPSCQDTASTGAMPFFARLSFVYPILRLKCPSCGKTISLLPDFLLPHFQYSLEYILIAVREFLVKKKDHHMLPAFTILPAQVFAEPEPY